MSKFIFKKSAEKLQLAPTLEEGVHAPVVVQVADIGLQLHFNRDKDPEEQMAVAFELENGELIAGRMKFSDHPWSSCFASFTSAFPDLDQSDQELGLSDLLGKSVLIEVGMRDGKWPRVTGIMPLEEGFQPVTPKTELLEFYVDEMDREVYREVYRRLRPEIRSWVSRRVRHA